MINSCRELTIAALGTAYWNSSNANLRSEIQTFLQDEYRVPVSEALQVAMRYVGFIGADADSPDRRSGFELYTPQEGRDLFGTKYNPAARGDFSSLTCPAPRADAPVFVPGNLDACHREPLVRIAQLYASSHPLSTERRDYFDSGLRLLNEWMRIDGTSFIPMIDQETAIAGLNRLAAEAGAISFTPGSVQFERDRALRLFRACPPYEPIRLEPMPIQTPVTLTPQPTFRPPAGSPVFFQPRPSPAPALVFQSALTGPRTYAFVTLVPAPLAWSFGDGTTSTELAPVHTYAAPGTYTVSLTAMVNGATQTATSTLTVAPDVDTAASSGTSIGLWVAGSAVALWLLSRFR